MPDEIIVVDGGSTDGTLDVLRAARTRAPLFEKSLKIMSRLGANISQGRNIAIQAATGDIICSTDAGVRLAPTWLSEIVRPIEEAQADVVSGFFVPDPCGVFETALAATTLPALADIQPNRFLPSSRSIAFRKEAWRQAGGYPEWLDYGEDLVFDFALLAAPCRFVFAPRALVQFRPRSTLQAFFKQYYLYARGDGKADLWLKRHLIRYGTYGVALPAVLALTWAVPPAALFLWMIGALAMFFTPYKRLVPMLRGLRGLDRLRAWVWVPVIRVTGDVAKMLGYPAGVLWRLRNRPRSSSAEREK